MLPCIWVYCFRSKKLLASYVLFVLGRPWPPILWLVNFSKVNYILVAVHVTCVRCGYVVAAVLGWVRSGRVSVPCMHGRTGREV
jgi:hypothetical protein